MYNKLFSKILDSSIWLEPAETRIVWITLLAAMDEDGFAHFSAIENLASRARVTVEQAAKAVECFIAPDPNSGNPANEGRRIERVPGGFIILNAAIHREVISRVIQREQNRQRVAKHRSTKAVTHCNADTVTAALPSVTPVYVSDSASESPLQGSAHQQFVAAWVAAYKTAKSFEYRFNGQKDGAAVKRLLATNIPVPDLLAVANKAWRTEGYWCKHAATIVGFDAKLNEIRAELNPPLPKPKHIL